MIDYLALFVHPDDWVWYHWLSILLLVMFYGFS